jgi:hypothetical protein
MMKNNNFLKIHIVALSLFLSSFSFSLDNGEFTYSIVGGDAQITGCVGLCPAHLVIPAEVNGLSVFAIGGFSQSGILTVEIPIGIETIDGNAFAYNLLQEVDIPNSVQVIESFAFSNNRLKKVNLGSSVERIKSNAFDANDISVLNIPDSVTYIGDAAFAGEQVKLVLFGSNLSYIGSYGFGVGSYGSSITALFKGNIPSMSSPNSNGSFHRRRNSNFLSCQTSGWVGNSITVGDYTSYPVEYYEFCDLDSDMDGEINFIDIDDDNDGVNDDLDAFPLLATEHQDSDSDGIGDDADIDDDNDGIEDSFDALPNDPSEYLDTDIDGIGNNLDVDDDGDGVADVIDIFPLDPNESADSDGDGLGNNTDFFPNSAEYSLDSDLDQMPDAWERKYGLNPTDASDAVLDHDGDGLSALEEYEAGTIPLKILDIDANGSVDALTDGLMVLRYLFGLRGQGLISNGTASDAMRTEADDIEAYIQSLMPGF